MIPHTIYQARSLTGHILRSFLLGWGLVLTGWKCQRGEDRLYLTKTVYGDY